MFSYFRLAKKEKEAAGLEKQVKTTEILNQDLQRRVNQLGAENRKLENQLRVCFLLFSITNIVSFRPLFKFTTQLPFTIIFNTN